MRNKLTIAGLTTIVIASCCRPKDPTPTSSGNHSDSCCIAMKTATEKSRMIPFQFKKDKVNTLTYDITPPAGYDFVMEYFSVKSKERRNGLLRISIEGGIFYLHQSNKDQPPSTETCLIGNSHHIIKEGSTATIQYDEPMESIFFSGYLVSSSNFK